MSFRELRNFTERMKCLGYHRLISMENFRNPNFELVADVLYWLAERLDPNCDLSDDISSEAARVQFIKAAARIVMVKANLRLNVRKLYQADGYAVQELHKVAAFLFQATSISKQNGNTPGQEINPEPGRPPLDTKGVASGIIESGGQLYSNLGNEPQLKEARDRAIRFIDEMSHNLESDDPQQEIEKSMRFQIQALSEHLSMLKTNCAGLESDRVQIQSRIERKQADIERASKRLKTIKKVKPAFISEYESLENELKIVYREYMEKFTNLTYLEDEQRRVELQDEESRLESERHLRKMRRHLRDEELRILRGEQQVDENDIDGRHDDNDDDDDDDEEQGSLNEESDTESPVGRPSSKAPGPVRLARPGAADPRGRLDYPGNGQVIGSMLDGNDDDDEDSADFNDQGQEFYDEDDDMGSEQEDEEEEEEDQESGDDTDF